MRTYFDQSRLGPETDRRFHACDLERVGGYVQVVPAVVEQMAPLVDVGAWGRNEARLLEQAAENAFATGVNTTTRACAHGRATGRLWHTFSLNAMTAARRRRSSWRR